MKEGRILKEREGRECKKGKKNIEVREGWEKVYEGRKEGRKEVYEGREEGRKEGRKERTTDGRIEVYEGRKCMKAGSL